MDDENEDSPETESVGSNDDDEGLREEESSADSESSAPHGDRQTNDLSDSFDPDSSDEEFHDPKAARIRRLAFLSLEGECDSEEDNGVRPSSSSASEHNDKNDKHELEMESGPIRPKNSSPVNEMKGSIGDHVNHSNLSPGLHGLTTTPNSYSDPVSRTQSKDMTQIASGMPAYSRSNSSENESTDEMPRPRKSLEGKSFVFRGFQSTSHLQRLVEIFGGENGRKPRPYTTYIVYCSFPNPPKRDKPFRKYIDLKRFWSLTKSAPNSQLDQQISSPSDQTINENSSTPTSPVPTPPLSSYSQVSLVAYENPATVNAIASNNLTDDSESTSDDQPGINALQGSRSSFKATGIPAQPAKGPSLSQYSLVELEMKVDAIEGPQISTISASQRASQDSDTDSDSDVESIPHGEEDISRPAEEATIHTGKNGAASKVSQNKLATTVELLSSYHPMPVSCRVLINEWLLHDRTRRLVDLPCCTTTAPKMLNSTWDGKPTEFKLRNGDPLKVEMYGLSTRSTNGSWKSVIVAQGPSKGPFLIGYCSKRRTSTLGTSYRIWLGVKGDKEGFENGASVFKNKKASDPLEQISAALEERHRPRASSSKVASQKSAFKRPSNKRPREVEEDAQEWGPVRKSIRLSSAHVLPTGVDGKLSTSAVDPAHRTTSFPTAKLELHISNNTVFLFYSSNDSTTRPRLLSACNTVEKVFAQALAGQVFRETAKPGGRVLSFVFGCGADRNSRSMVVEDDEDDFQALLERIKHAEWWTEDDGEVRGSGAVEVRGIS